ncbi:hypothetical protein L202_00277 [Cryptococcus amylolentus CBS 6039]|uniref:Epoxide hydrolase N-terminal domain-containing protein n=1 Tax=Cryptococcus amylolentus CBS 6039 TaxID=1295533 RepID=A0A1E3I6W0_9TREE|nr:hypothetical protein L202_00277 [Cryptococcus amylolentus CBS 6039]ODN84297.1 hypothetical protein L202_00277 [Cryptococcus amylolentus CBS 6039]
MSYATLPHQPTIPIRPFSVSIPDSDIQDLHSLLKSTRIAKQSYENAESAAKVNNFGVSREWLVNMRDEWLNYDWRKEETRINSFPAYIATLKNKDGLDYDIHFTGLFSQKKDAVPIILSHGWPGTFLEFVPILELVRKQYTPETLPYHLVVTSLPGWIFSSPPAQDREFGVKDVGYLWNELMVGLGFGDGYMSQGGDIGSYVTMELGSTYDQCKAIHLNYRHVLHSVPPDAPPSDISPPPPPSTERLFELFQNFGYFLEHATRPSTIGLVAGSNPLSLLAWIGEKYVSWTDETPGVDTILAFASLYWFTDCFSTSLYTYRYGAGIKRKESRAEHEYQSCPTGFSFFPKEFVPVSLDVVKASNNLVWYKQHDAGGHFAALEKPDVLWADIEDFVGTQWEKCSRKTGRV